MTARRTLIATIALAVIALLGFQAFVRRVSLVSFNFAGTREVRELLDRSMQDQKQLSRLDPARGTDYRRRFEDIRDVRQKLDVVALNRAEIARRYEWILLAVFAAAVTLALALYALALRRREQRLARLQSSLEALSRGDVDVSIDDRSRDLIGRIAAMIEQTSRDIGRDRRRLQYLDHLSAWQEAARRHAHEIRTPLTAARLEVDRLVETAGEGARQAQASIHEELDRLREFTRQFTSFARVGQPRLAKQDLWEAVEEFRATFAEAWDLRLVLEKTSCDCTVLIDREMFRQVLVNLCNNSALAGAKAVTFRAGEERRRLLLDVSDDGPGIDPAIRARLFEPYTTTRPIGEGMGLGLAISKKIMLDHGGDLELIESARGATFRISIPREGHA
ncbi:MAG TPA: HAMP domain-containing sensor histidine kinase [Thermoanaerobaculia bacterium]|jgi:signal transduction histidine kinase